MARTLELDTITEPSNSGTANITLSSNTTTTMPLVDINGGAIDGTTVGAGTPSSVAATTLSTSGNATVGGTLGITGLATVGGTLGVTGNTTLAGNTTVGGTLGVTGLATVGGTLGVTGNTTLAGSANNVGTVTAGTWEGTDVGVAHGGTGASTLTDGGVLLGSGTGAITATAVLADGEMLVGDGSTDPAIESGSTLRTSIGLGNVANETRATILASVALTGTPTIDASGAKTMSNWYVGNSATGLTTATYTIGASTYIFWVTFSSTNTAADLFCYGGRLAPGDWLIQGTKIGHGTPSFFSGSTTIADANNTYSMAVNGGSNQVTFSRSLGETNWNYHIKYLTNSR